MSATNKLQQQLASINDPTRVRKPPTSASRATPQPDAAPASREATPRARWEDAHRRATFHLPNELLDELDQTARRTGRNKSELVRTALGAYLHRLDA